MKSLYTNIPNREGIEVVKENLNARTEKRIETKVIITFLFLILKRKETNLPNFV